MARTTLADLEQIIGKASGIKELGVAIASIVSDNPHAFAALKEWCIKQGLTYKAVNAALTTSLVSAYTSPGYLKSWRERVNPSFALLHDAIDAIDSVDDNEQVSSPDTEIACETCKGEGVIYKQISPAMSTATEVRCPDCNGSGNASSSMGLSDTINVNSLSQAEIKNLLDKLAPEINAKLETRLSAFKADIPAGVKNFLANYKMQITFSDEEKAKIEAWAERKAHETIERLLPPQRIEVVNQALGTPKDLGLQHKNFPLLLNSAQARDHKGNRLNIWLTGPTGSGKTSAAEAAANALGLPFGADGSLDADYKVIGFRDANGNVIETEFRRIFTSGGIYVADEIDNWHPGALLALNAALANGWCSFPDGMTKRHPDCIIIACANTWGHGATNEYVGRSKLDAASLNRFSPKIDWPVDEDLERAVAKAQGGSMGLAWCDLTQSIRRFCKTSGTKIIISPRDTFNGISLLKQGFEWGQVILMTFASGLSTDQLRSLQLDTKIKSTTKANAWADTVEVTGADGLLEEAAQ